MADSDQSEATKTVTKLLLSAEHYTSVSPALARFYLLEVERLKKKLCLPPSSASQICSYCHTIWRPGNCTRRLLSRMKMGKQIRRLERRNADGRKVGRLGKQLLDLRSDGVNRLQIRCHSCGKRTFVRGACRPAKLARADRVAETNCEAEVPKMMKKSSKKRQTGESRTTAADIFARGSEVKRLSSEKRPNQTPLHSEAHVKGRITNKKETLKHKHSMLRNILKKKTSAASPDTSAALKSFLMTL